MSILKSNEAYGSFKALGKDIFNSMFNPMDRLQQNPGLAKSFKDFVGENPGKVKMFTGLLRTTAQDINGNYSAPHIATIGALTFGKVGITAALGYAGIESISGKEKS